MSAEATGSFKTPDFQETVPLSLNAGTWFVPRCILASCTFIASEDSRVTKRPHCNVATDKEIVDQGVKKIKSGLRGALDLVHIGPGQTATDFLRTYERGTGTVDDDAFWQEANNVSTSSKTYQWILRYISSCKRLCLEEKESEKSKEGTAREKWKILAAGMNELTNLLWDSFGPWALLLLTAMASKSFRFASFTQLGPARRQTVIKGMYEELKNFKGLRQPVSVNKAFRVLNPAMTLSEDKDVKISYDETCQRLGLGKLTAIAMPPKWALFFSIQDLDKATLRGPLPVDDIATNQGTIDQHNTSIPNPNPDEMERPDVALASLPLRADRPQVNIRQATSFPLSDLRECTSPENFGVFSSATQVDITPRIIQMVEDPQVLSNLEQDMATIFDFNNSLGDLGFTGSALGFSGEAQDGFISSYPQMNFDTQ